MIVFVYMSEWIAVVNCVVKFGQGFVFTNHLYANEFVSETFFPKLKNVRPCQYWLLSCEFIMFNQAQLMFVLCQL